MRKRSLPSTNSGVNPLGHAGKLGNPGLTRGSHSFGDTMLAYKVKDLIIEYEHKGKRWCIPFKQINKVGIPLNAIIVDLYLAPKEECTQEDPVKQEGIIPMFPNAKINQAAANAGAGVIINAPAELDTAEEQRKYIGRRALGVIDNKIVELREKFKLDFYYRPKTVQEAADRIKAGLFTLRGSEKKDPTPYYGLDGHFSWRGPDDQADCDGYGAAVSKFIDFYIPLMDEIRIFDPKDALESLRKIEAYVV